MKKTRFIWQNGKFIKWDLAKIHILSHALHYGSGVFEGIRAYETPRGPAVFRLSDHVDRLFRSAASLGMRVPYSKKTITSAIRKIVSINKLGNCYIRPIVFYETGQMALAPHGARVAVSIAAWPWGSYFGEHKALSVGVSRYIRFHPDSAMPGAKISGLYATSVLAVLEARKRGFDEAILLDHEGFVAEGPGENIFIVKRGKLFTPKSSSILPGITRASIMAIAQGFGIPTAEKKITPEAFAAADEIFLTGTATEVAPVGKVNGRRIGTGGVGSITARLRAAYLDAARGNFPRYKRWLTSV